MFSATVCDHTAPADQVVVVAIRQVSLVELTATPAKVEVSNFISCLASCVRYQVTAENRVTGTKQKYLQAYLTLGKYCYGYKLRLISIYGFAFVQCSCSMQHRLHSCNSIYKISALLLQRVYKRSKSDHPQQHAGDFALTN